MNALEGFRDDALDALKVGPLRGPVARGPTAVLAAAYDDGGEAGLFVLRCGVKHGELLPRGEVRGVRPSGARPQDLVPQACIREGASRHDEIVAPSRTVCVVIDRLDAHTPKEACGGRISGDFPRGADVVGGHRVTQVEQAVRLLDILELGQVLGHRLEEGGVVDVGRLGPGIQRGVRGCHKALPPLVARRDGSVGLFEEFGHAVGGHDLIDLGRGRPDVLQEDFLALRIGSDGVLQYIDVRGTSQGEGYHQRGRGQIGAEDVGMDARLEVPVPREHGRGHHLVPLDALRHPRLQLARIPNAGGAPVPNDVKAELLHVGKQTRLLQVERGNAGPGAAGGLDKRLHGEPGLDGLL
eukprot:144089_1